MQTAKDVHALLAAADTDGGIFKPRAALATMLRTVGSSFRRPGSRMLIGGNGRVVRGFSGGCPESDLTLRARQVIDSGQPQRVLYDREHGLDLLIELGCGGELEIVLEPLAQRSSLRFLDVIAELCNSRSPAMMVSVFARDLTLDEAIGRLVWRGEEILHDTLPAGMRAASIIEAVGNAGGGREAGHRKFVDAAGEWDVLYEPIRPPIQLVLIGANAVADTLAQMAQQLAWSIVRINPQTMAAEAFGQKYTMPHTGTPLLHDAQTFVVCMTYNLERDLDFAAAALAISVPYVGILGSHRRAAQVRQRLGERFANAVHERLYTPAGLSIGSEDAEEIAVSLIAEIMAVSARKSGTPLSRSSEPIHAHGPENT